jgi:hypothetical protein
MTLELAEAVVTGCFAGVPGLTMMIVSVREHVDYYAFTTGAREWVVDVDSAYLIDGVWPVFISKATGWVETAPGVFSAVQAHGVVDGMDVLYVTVP